MKITKSWLEKQEACSAGADWFVAQNTQNGVDVVKKLIAEKKLNWANWLIVRIMRYPQYTSYAVYAAEQVIDIYEKKYPDDKRPRIAIEAAKRCIKNPSRKNKDAAYAAADAAYAAYAAYAAANAAYAAANAAYAAYAAADAAAYAAYAANAAANAAAYAAYATYAAALQLKILDYGLKLLGGK